MGDNDDDMVLCEGFKDPFNAKCILHIQSGRGFVKNVDVRIL